MIYKWQKSTTKYESYYRKQTKSHVCIADGACTLFVFAYQVQGKMTEESVLSNTSHLFVAMSTTQTDEHQTTATMTTPLLIGDGFYFECAVVIVGVMGTAANGLVLYAMIASKQHKKQFLIFNQNILDLCSCLLLVVTYTLKLCNIRLAGMFGYLLCMLIFSESLLWSIINGSIINLMSIAVERYLKVVHHTCVKKVLRKWAIHSQKPITFLLQAGCNTFTWCNRVLPEGSASYLQ